MKTYFTYILASRRNGTRYVGVTNDLARRIHEHREGLVGGFTRRYAVKMLVHCEVFDDVRLAIQRERNLKKWPRAWKLALIEKHNADWCDLYEGLLS